jgi:hypothetical protein
MLIAFVMFLACQSGSIGVNALTEERLIVQTVLQHSTTIH